MAPLLARCAWVTYRAVAYEDVGTATTLTQQRCDNKLMHYSIAHRTAHHTPGLRQGMRKSTNELKAWSLSQNVTKQILAALAILSSGRLC